MKYTILLFFTIFFSELILSQTEQETAFVKYFRTEKDFVAGNSMLATDRGLQPYLQVSYNENKLPILKSWVGSDGEIVPKEVLEYDLNKKLRRQAFLKEDQEVTRFIQYGQDEAWSVEFRNYAYPKSLRLTFNEQQTLFTFNAAGQVSEIRFKTIDRVPYGRISLHYDYLGFLQDEIWRSLPDETIIRRFVYDYDIMTNVQQIWEYASGEEALSHVALQMAPADQLYRVPPPRTGNILDEVDIIMKEIRARRVVVPIPAFIPKMEWDRLMLVTGEELPIDFISKEESGIRFRLKGEEDVLNIPYSRIESVTSKWGALIYP